MAALVHLLRVPRGGRLLEIGCGRGIGLVPLGALRAAGNPDRARHRRRPARARTGAAHRVPSRRPAPTRRHPRLPFDDDSVDVVVDFGTCYHVARPEAALAEIERVLAPGGLFVCESRSRSCWRIRRGRRGAGCRGGAAPLLVPHHCAGLWSSRVKLAWPGRLKRWRPVAEWLALWLAATVFIWMFLASDGVARTGGRGRGGRPRTSYRASAWPSSPTIGATAWSARRSSCRDSSSPLPRSLCVTVGAPYGPSGRWWSRRSSSVSRRRGHSVVWERITWRRAVHGEAEDRRRRSACQRRARCVRGDGDVRGVRGAGRHVPALRARPRSGAPLAIPACRLRRARRLAGRGCEVRRAAARSGRAAPGRAT